MDSPPEHVETVQSARPSQQLIRPDVERPRRLVFKPLIKPSGPSRYEIRGQYEDKSIIAWGFWGGVLVVAVAVFLVVNSGSIYSLWDMLWALAAIAVGFLLYRYGKRSSLRDDMLCEVDLLRGRLAWPTGADGRLAIDFDSITEIVFGMTEYPVSEQKSEVYVHAFTLLVRDDRERLIPVVEATPDKEEAHTIARILSKELGMSISYVGKGIR